MIGALDLDQLIRKQSVIYKIKLIVLFYQIINELLFSNQSLTNSFLGVFLEYLQLGKCTAKEVLRTYQEKAIKAHRKTNCVVTFITVSWNYFTTFTTLNI